MMAGRYDELEFDMWTDAPCRTFFNRPLRPVRIVTARPPTTITQPRQPALDSVTAQVTVAMRRIRLTDGTQWIKGVRVKPTKTARYMAYQVSNEKAKLTLAEAIARVVALAEEAAE